MEQNFNNLTPAETERLAILSEECGEVIQAVGKILRHGYESNYSGGPTNRETLQSECADVAFATGLLIQAQDISAKQIALSMGTKADRVVDFLHHQFSTEG